MSLTNLDAAIEVEIPTRPQIGSRIIQPIITVKRDIIANSRTSGARPDIKYKLETGPNVAFIVDANAMIAIAGTAAK